MFCGRLGKKADCDISALESSLIHKSCYEQDYFNDPPLKSLLDFKKIDFVVFTFY